MTIIGDTFASDFHITKAFREYVRRQFKTHLQPHLKLLTSTFKVYVVTESLGAVKTKQEKQCVTGTSNCESLF